MIPTDPLDGQAIGGFIKTRNRHVIERSGAKTVCTWMQVVWRCKAIGLTEFRSSLIAKGRLGAVET
jgi:hypothetical protein